MWDHTEKCYEAFYFSGLNGTRTEDFKRHQMQILEQVDFSTLNFISFLF